MAKRGNPDTIGAKLGPRLARLMGDASASTFAKTTPHRVRAALDFQDKFFRIVHGEGMRTVGPFLRSMAESPEVPEDFRRIAAEVSGSPGQLHALVLALANVAALYGSFSRVGANHLATWEQQRFRAEPHTPIAAGEAAAAVARGVITSAAGEREGATNAVNVDRFHTLVELAQTWPAIGEALELLRRGRISDTTAHTWLVRNGLHASVATTLLELARTPLSPADAALMVVRGIIDEAQGERIAGEAGLTSHDFQRLVEATGEPPAIQELLFLHRRGKIDKSRLERGIRQSRVRNEWIDAIEALSLGPPTSPEALSAATQNLLSNDEAKRIVEENGVDGKYFDWMLESNGRPLSPTEAGELFNRGIITHAQARQMFLESTVKNKYVDYYFPLFERIPPERTVVSMVGKGVTTKERGIQMLRDLGFSHENAVALVNEALTTKHEKHRDLAVSQITELYELRSFTRAEAIKHLEALGFDATEAGFVLQLADVKRSRKLQDQAINVLHSLFIRYRIDEREMLNRLDALHLAADQRDHLVDIWKLEREASTKDLTAAQIVKGFKGHILDEVTAVAMLINIGYVESDAKYLLLIA